MYVSFENVKFAEIDAESKACEICKNMNFEDLITLWNNIENVSPIYEMADFDEVMEGKSPLEIVRLIGPTFRPYDGFFRMNSLGLYESISYANVIVWIDKERIFDEVLQGVIKSGDY